ncbi:LCP family protein [Tessaracoccus defluvii]|uniref:LCP family protein n=1 Tax=Tessaracoccus defluvii TaxID=1285901 RepID=UPI0031D12B04
MSSDMIPDDQPAGDASRPDVGRREKRRNRRVLFVVLALLVAVVAGGIGVASYYAKSAIDALDNITREPTIMPTTGSSNRPPTVEPVPGVEHAPLNIVLMGSDTRGDERGRSDVLQLLHISGDRKGVYLMSIPRDSWVDIPGRGKAKINAAYSWGGPALTIETMEQLLEVPMDHTAIIDFEGFTKVIDTLGGITVYNREASSSRGATFPKGDITLNGADALIFVRERYGLSDGDFGRATRQRDVIKAVLTKLASAGTLTDPGKFREAVTTLGGNFTVDAGLTNDAIIDLGWQMKDFHPADIRSFQLPTAGFDMTGDGQSIVVVDSDKIVQLREALRNDTMEEFYSSL